MTADPGTWPQTASLARSLHEVGVEVVIAGLAGPLRAPPYVLRAAVHESSWRVEWMPEPWQDLASAGDWIAALAERYAPDLVHLAHPGLAARPWGRPVVVAAHGCALSWWEATRGRPASSGWDLYYAHMARGLHAATVVVAPTRSFLQALTRQYGPLPDARVVPYALEAGLVPTSHETPFVLGLPGVWDDAIGRDLLDRAASRLAVPVWALGGGAEAPRHLRFADNADGWAVVARWLVRRPIVVQSARYDPFGWHALQAGALGCPLVLADLPSLREVWGDAACFVDPHDEEALVELLDALATVEELRSAMAERARRRAATFTIARARAGWLSAYEAALDAPGLQEVGLARGDVLSVPRLGLESP